MAFKRKRSASELTTLFNSPARSDSSVESFDFPVSPSLAFPRAFAAPSHLSSRTMKRFRNNRPSEEEVHQRTLKMLYSAQQQNQPSVEEHAPAPAPAPAARNTQKSLHSFWNISSAAPALSRTASPPVDQMALNPTSCDDCGVGLGSSGDADGMDVDGDDGSCGACGKHIGVASFKLKKLWDELQEVPEQLADWVAELQFWQCIALQIGVHI
ncbi:hypothetical protein CkaCkLH20_05600 [Colletotrichum karsti]|uniref:Uncharacterized protein n=1 Tax=Colletotrichum karsti TaxID=1095194 RepID=A0A9P6I5S3_9PEZI|nr:uncharacterized protein CkaCkLH20_05600 [Colletotrichum karsti]KAF9876754.1 hypothetical protein CkaCkLH20_05600 [Colletotrichum karsti]